MTAPGRYLVVDTAAWAGGPGALNAAMTRLRQAGWTPAVEVSDLIVMLAPGSTLAVRQIHRRHILIGDYQGHEPPSHLCGRTRSSKALARAMIDQGWGRYVLVWRDPDRGLCVLCAPPGGLDAVWWMSQGAVVISDGSSDPVEAFVPDELDVDWSALERIATDVSRAADIVPLRGVKAIVPGALTELPGGLVDAVWTPDGAARADDFDDRPSALAEIIDRTVDALVQPHARIVCEISGGLDSAIVSASLARLGLGDRAVCINYYTDQPEGDERSHARAVAAWLGLPLTEVRKPPARLDLAALSTLESGFRPSLHGLDLAYEMDLVKRLKTSGATGLLTGQAGDSVFFQAPDPLVLRDRVLRLGPLSIGPRRIGEVARWTRTSARRVVTDAFRPERRIDPPTDAHPWVRAAWDLPPAKRGQVCRFVNAQLFWGDCPRARAADLLHPLLSQPVAEHCLAVPSDRLVSPVASIARDRALARQAFEGRLPPTHLARRDKGDLSRFYTLLVRDNRAHILTYLGDGLLARQGWFDDAPLEPALSLDRLISDPASNRFLIWCGLEAWARQWSSRIDRLLRSDVTV